MVTYNLKIGEDVLTTDIVVFGASLLEVLLHNLLSEKNKTKKQLFWRIFQKRRYFQAPIQRLKFVLWIFL